MKTEKSFKMILAGVSLSVATLIGLTSCDDVSEQVVQYEVVQHEEVTPPWISPGGGGLLPPGGGGIGGDPGGGSVGVDLGTPGYWVTTEVNGQTVRACAIPLPAGRKAECWVLIPGFNATSNALNAYINENNVAAFFNEALIKGDMERESFIKRFHPSLVEDIRNSKVTLKHANGVNQDGEVVGFTYYPVSIKNPTVEVKYDYITK